MEEKFLEAIKKLRAINEKKRKFAQTVDLIINLKDFDVKKYSFSSFIQLPNMIKDKKIAAFFEKDNKLIKTIKKEDFAGYNEKKVIKKTIKDYDFFIANAKLMPAVATTFGRFLGPVGKMPSPQLGIIMNEDENSIKETVNRINSSIKIRIKEPSIKVGIANEGFQDEKIAENAVAVYKKVLELLPKKIDNIKNVKIKFTMTKPVGVDIK